jgi:hypothetical protein
LLFLGNDEITRHSADGSFLVSESRDNSKSWSVIARIARFPEYEGPHSCNIRAEAVPFTDRRNGMTGETVEREGVVFESKRADGRFVTIESGVRGTYRRKW